MSPVGLKSRFFSLSLTKKCIFASLWCVEGRCMSSNRAVMGKNKNKAQPGAGDGPQAKKQRGNPAGFKQPNKFHSVPGSIDIQVVGSGRDGTPRGVFVNMDHFKYLFNCGEGTQRVAMEHRMRFSRLTEIFITHRSWDNVSGLMGMCLSLESVGATEVQIHGPPAVERIVTMSKGFAQLRTIRITKREAVQRSHTDSAMKITYIPVFPEKSTTQSSESQADIEDDDMTMVYLCQPHPKPRGVLMEKCVDMGVKSGPHVGLLKKGQDVTLEDGRVVHPDDVLSPPEANNPFLVLECPSERYIEPLVTNEQMAAVMAPREDGRTPGLVIHLTPRSIMADPRYLAWVHRFGPSVKHIVLNEDGGALAFEGLYRIQAMLNLMDSSIFPLLPHQVNQSCNCPKASEVENISYGETNLVYILRRKSSGVFVRDQCITLDNAAYVSEAQSDEGFPEALAQTTQALQQERQKAEGSCRYPEILFLGTGSAIPSKVRNVSAIWLNLSESQSILMDCGENTYGQLYRHYGNEVGSMLQNLEAVFVSHLHADHHLGIISIARARKRVLEESGKPFTPLSVIAPFHLSLWYKDLEEMLRVPLVNLVRVIPIEWFCPQWVPKEGREADEGRLNAVSQLKETLGMKELQSVRVIHRQFPHAVVLTHESGWKLAYSGDTMPCDDLAAAAADCDVLIHEASMEDDLADEAMAKKHSTTSQAIDIGLKANARFILLTHFSQRYAKVPLFNDNFSSRVGIAFDNMRVSLHELPLLPHILPSLKVIFAQDYADMEERTTRKYLNKKVKVAEESRDIRGEGAASMTLNTVKTVS